MSDDFYVGQVVRFTKTLKQTDTVIIPEGTLGIISAIYTKPDGNLHSAFPLTVAVNSPNDVPFLMPTDVKEIEVVRDYECR